MNTLQANGKYLKRSTISIAMLLCLFLFSSCVGKYKERISDLEYEISRLEEENDELRSRVSRLNNEMRYMESRIYELEEIIDYAHSQAEKIRTDLILWENDRWIIQSDVSMLISTLQY